MNSSKKAEKQAKKFYLCIKKLIFLVKLKPDSQYIKRLYM